MNNETMNAKSAISALLAECTKTDDITSVTDKPVIYRSMQIEKLQNGYEKREVLSQRECINSDCADVVEMMVKKNKNSLATQVAGIVLKRETGNTSNNSRSKGGKDLDLVITALSKYPESFDKGFESFSKETGITRNDFRQACANNKDSINIFWDIRYKNNPERYISIKGMKHLIYALILKGNPKANIKSKYQFDFTYLARFKEDELISYNDFRNYHDNFDGCRSNSTAIIPQFMGLIKGLNLGSIPSGRNKLFSLNETGVKAFNSLK